MDQFLFIRDGGISLARNENHSPNSRSTIWNPLEFVKFSIYHIDLEQKSQITHLGLNSLLMQFKGFKNFGYDFEG